MPSLHHYSRQRHYVTSYIICFHAVCLFSLYLVCASFLPSPFCLWYIDRSWYRLYYSMLLTAILLLFIELLFVKVDFTAACHRHDAISTRCNYISHVTSFYARVITAFYARALPTLYVNTFRTMWVDIFISLLWLRDIVFNDFDASPPLRRVHALFFLNNTIISIIAIDA